ncbi:hypothetical protein KC343_g18663, partial [Hortaea werneckii]
AVPTPTPENDFLGFCKGAWKLQNGDRKAMTKSKEFNEGWSGNSIYLLACTQSKCAFAGHLPLDQIWTKVITVEAKGMKIRWPFLAKSHIQQYKVRREKQYQFQCMFCVYLNNAVQHEGQKEKRETYTGTDAYLEHVSQAHRGETLGAILMYKTRCITERVAEDTEEFDVNLWPLSVPEQLDRSQAAGVSGEKAAAYTNGSLEEAPDSGVSEQPWNEGLSEFHWGGELERSERD